MNRILFGLTCLVSSIVAGSLEQSSCMLNDDFTAWDLRSAKAVKEKGKFQYYTSGNLTWNLCSYIKWEDTAHNQDYEEQEFPSPVETFAYLSDNGAVYPITDEIFPDRQLHLNADYEVDGLTYIFQSHTPCQIQNQTRAFYGFQNTMMCNKDIKGKGAARIVSVTGEQTCLPKVVMEHESGCPLVNFSGFVKFLDQNAWIYGTILFVLGVVLVFFGRVFFRVIMAALGGVVSFCAIMYLTSLFGWLSATWSVVVFVIVALAIGLACGYFTYLLTPISMGLLGVVGGFVGGAALFSLILSISGYDALWLLVTLVIVGALGFGILTCVFRFTFLSLTTSIVGGYMVMRGASFWFGHYPSEMEMFTMMTHGGNLQLEWQFWWYFGTFVVVSLFGIVWQTKWYTDTDKSVDDYYHSCNENY